MTFDSTFIRWLDEKNNSISNKNYASDVARTFQYTRILLQILGIWPMVKKNSNQWETLIGRVLITICSILLAFILIPCTLHMIFREQNSKVKIMLLGPIGFCVTNILKYFSMIVRRRMIKNCMDHVELDWISIKNHNDREIMTRNIKFGRNLTMICGIFLYTGGLSYNTIMPIWRGNEKNELNETIRPLVYPGYDIFINSQISPNYEIIFFTICISACVTYTITTAACNLAAIFVAHTCGQIGIIMSRLESLFDDKENEDDRTDETLKTRVGFIINTHVRVLKFASMIEALLHEICLVEVVASTLIICLLEYYCLTEWNNSETIAIIIYFTLLMSLTFNIFIFCHIGELLKEQCSQVGKAVYTVDWYRFPGKTGLDLVMIIAMSNTPRKLTAGRMMELTVSSFGAIIKTSVVYLNMLRTMAG